MFILEPNEVTRCLPRKKVEMYDFPDGRIEVRYKGQILPYRTYNRVTRVDQGAIVEEGPPSALFGEPRHARTKSFLSSLRQTPEALHA